MSLSIYVECPCCGACAWDASPTYNLGPMWREAGMRFEDIEGKEMQEARPMIQFAVNRMEEDPERFKKLNPSNGWGDYDGLLSVLKGMLQQAVEHPKHKIRLWK